MSQITVEHLKIIEARLSLLSSTMDREGVDAKWESEVDDIWSLVNDLIEYHQLSDDERRIMLSSLDQRRRAWIERAEQP